MDEKQNLLDLEDATKGMADFFSSRIPQEESNEESTESTEENVDKEEDNKEEDKKNTKQQLNIEDLFELDTTEDPASNNQNIFVPHVAALIEAGVLPKDTDLEIFKTAEPEQQVQLLIDAQNNTIIERANSLLETFVENLPPKLRKAFETYSDGVDIDLAFEIANKIDYYKQIDKSSFEDDSELAKRVVIEDLMERGYSKEDAEETVEDMINPSKHAPKALDRLIASEEKKIQSAKDAKEQTIKDTEKAQQQYMGNLKKYIDNTPEYIQGFKVEGTLRKKMFDKVTKVVEAKDGQNLNHFGKLLYEDPIGMQVKLAYLSELTNDFKDFSKILPAIKTNAVKEFEDVLKSKSAKSIRNSGSSSSINYESNKGDGDSFIEYLKKVKIK